MSHRVQGCSLIAPRSNVRPCVLRVAYPVAFGRRAINETLLSVNSVVGELERGQRFQQVLFGAVGGLSVAEA